MTLTREQARQLGGFHRRTILLGWLGIILVGLTMPLCLNGLDLILERWLDAKPDHLPMVHIPSAVREASGTSLLVWVVYGVLFLAVYGLSIGVFKRRNLFGMLLVVCLVGLIDLAINSPTRQALLILPSALERDIRAGRFGEAERILESVSAPAPAANYVKAQIALHANDLIALKRLTPPLLKTADAYVYSVSDNGALPSESSNDPHADFNASVIHAIDLKSNGRITSGIGIEYENRKKLQFWSRNTQLTIQGATTLGLIGLTVLVLRLWLQMRGRVIRLNELIAKEENQHKEALAALPSPST